MAFVLIITYFCHNNKIIFSGYFLFTLIVVTQLLFNFVLYFIFIKYQTPKTRMVGLIVIRILGIPQMKRIIVMFSPLMQKKNNCNSSFLLAWQRLYYYTRVRVQQLELWKVLKPLLITITYNIIAETSNIKHPETVILGSKHPQESRMNILNLDLCAKQSVYCVQYKHWNKKCLLYKKGRVLQIIFYSYL